MATKSQSLEEFEADMAARQVAISAAGWTGPAARTLLIKSNTPADFAAHMREANEIRSVAKTSRPLVENAGFMLTDRAIEQSIVHQIPLADVRIAILNLLARHDEDTHTDTARRLTVQEPGTDVYADRAAQMKAARAQHGR